jgi:hypothetical protein
MMTSEKSNWKFPEPGVRYGERLLPHIIDDEAAKRPGRILGMIPKSSEISKGWTKITAKALANSINLTSSWIDEQIARIGTSKTIAYIVSNLFYVVTLA